MEFYQTMMGKVYYEAILPNIAKSLERIADALEELLKETDVTPNTTPEKKKIRYKCPTYDMGCPYLTKSGECTIGNPMEECDDYYYYNNDEE